MRARPLAVTEAELRTVTRPTALQRIVRRTIITATDCAQYTGTLNNSGYGMIGVKDRTRSVHRYAYELLVGPIPEGLVIDHLCRNRACWNVAHMEPVTNAENQARGAHKAKTHCKNGHPYDVPNTYVNRKGQRMCRACMRDRERAKRALGKPASE